MFSWNITNPDITGNDKEDIKELKKKIDEMNSAMRVLVVQLRKGNAEVQVTEEAVIEDSSETESETAT